MEPRAGNVRTKSFCPFPTDSQVVIKKVSREVVLQRSFTRTLSLLRRFSRVRLCATPWVAAHQAPPSLGFSRKEHWSGLPFPSPVHVSQFSSVAQSCPTLCDPMNRSTPGLPVHHQLPEFTQIHAPNPSQHQNLF